MHLTKLGMKSQNLTTVYHLLANSQKNFDFGSNWKQCKKRCPRNSELAPFLRGLIQREIFLRLSHLYQTISVQNAKMCFLLALPLDHTEKLSGFFFPGGVSLNHAQEWFTGRHRKPESLRGGGWMARILSGKRLSSRFFSTQNKWKAP